MFNFIRRHQRLMQLVLLVLILPSFVLIGVSGYTNYNSGDEDLVAIGDNAITAQEFDVARRNQLNEMQRTQGADFDLAVVDTPQVKKQLLDALIDRRVLIEVATSERFSVSDTALRQAIALMPELQEEGVFSAERYNQLLASAGMASRDFEQSQRAELALSRVVAPIAETAVLPAPINTALQNVLMDSRTVQTHVFDTSQFETDQEVSEQEITQWYQAHQEELQLPDYINAEFILLNEDAAVSSVEEINNENLLAYYEQNKSRFITPARVHLSHILIQPGASDSEHQLAQKQAKELAVQAQADPTKFAELAKAESQDRGSAANGGELGWITEGNWPHALQAAVFALKKDEVSGVIEGPDGYHIFKANDFQPEESQSFMSVREQLENEVRQQLAAERFANMATKLTDLTYENPESLDIAAQQLGLPLQQAQGIAKDRILSLAELGIESQPSEAASLLDDPRVRRALYSTQSIEQQQNAGVIELASDTIVALRVNEFVPSHVPSLEQLHDQVKQLLQQEKAVIAVREAGEQALAQLQAGSDIKLSMSEAVSVSRINNQFLPKAVLDALMATDSKELPAYVGASSGNGYYIVKILAVDKEGADSDPMVANLIQTQLQQLWGNAQELAYMQALRDQLQVKELPALEKAMSAELDSD